MNSLERENGVQKGYLKKIFVELCVSLHYRIFIFNKNISQVNKKRFHSHVVVPKK